MIYLHFNMLIIKNTELLIGSESIITCLHNTLSRIPCIHEFHWLGGKKESKDSITQGNQYNTLSWKPN